MNPTDFLVLYQQLGLRPDSTIDELKLAYRRRVADLHPDRRREGNAGDAERAGEHLRQLTALYGSATTFHRRHGRLPGAGIAARPTPMPMPAVAPIPTRRPGRTVATLAMLAGITLAAWLYFGPADDSDTGTSGVYGEPAATPSGASIVSFVDGEAPTLTLKLGLSRSDVLEIEKAPISQGEDRWDYGPSWIAFDRGKVSDWYSSPLRPLRRASSHPPPRVEEAASRN